MQPVSREPVMGSVDAEAILLLGKIGLIVIEALIEILAVIG